MKKQKLNKYVKKKYIYKYIVLTKQIGFGMIFLVVLVLLTFIIIKTLIPCTNSTSCESNSIEKIENGAQGTFQGQIIPVPSIIDTEINQNTSILGIEDPTSKKHIYVDLSIQKVFAFQGQTKIFETWVSTGRWGRTPTGNFHIWSKLRSTRMSGGSGSDYYNLPNVPFTMFYYRDYGLHGAYWHNNFGYTMSHGCVNLRPIDAEVLFNFADGPSNGKLGTEVSVCDSFTEPNICLQQNPVQ